ncbi:MAG: hypothetical protein RIQ95_497, partial [Pseudomonadota bacterium]
MRLLQYLGTISLAAVVCACSGGGGERQSNASNEQQEALNRVHSDQEPALECARHCYDTQSCRDRYPSDSDKICIG